MALLSDSDRIVVRDQLKVVSHRVTLLFFTQAIGAPETALIAKQVLDEVASLNDAIDVEEVNFVLDKDRAAQFGITDIPGVALLRDGEDTRMRFLGAPSGYEFMSLVQAVVLAGTGFWPFTKQQGRDFLPSDRKDRVDGLRYPHVSALPPGGEPGPPDGGREPAHHGDLRRGHRISGAIPPIQGDGGPQDGGDRHRQRRPLIEPAGNTWGCARRSVRLIAGASGTERPSGIEGLPIPTPAAIPHALRASAGRSQGHHGGYPLTALASRASPVFVAGFWP
jgi:hypothetical protein